MAINTRRKLKEDKDKIISLYKNGLVAKDIAKMLGYKYHQPIYNTLKKYCDYKPKNKDDYSYFRRYAVNESFFDNIDTEEKAYILGFIAADGYVEKGRIMISLNSIDKDILFKIREAMGSNHPIKDFIKDGKFKHSCLTINSVNICQKLSEYNLLSPKSLSMSNIIEFVPDEFKYHFMRGYFDGDGNIIYGAKYKSGTKYCVTIIGTKEFLETSFNSHFDTNNSIAKYKSCNMYYWRVTKRSLVDDFISKIYKNSSIYLDRKYNYCAHLKLL